jgi:hypothetical protein
MRPTLRYVQQVLRFADVEPALWELPVPQGYHLEHWSGRTPDELLASYAVARQAMDDAVSGDLKWDEPRWTPELVREHEAEQQANGFATRVVVAVDDVSGEVAGVTDVQIPGSRPDLVEQHYTAVRREHRGRALGLAMKAAQLRALAERPERGQVLTQTADLVHMASINRALGFEDLTESAYIAADLDAVEAVLGGA